jgi:AcrR family transcriptional regulator
MVGVVADRLDRGTWVRAALDAFEREGVAGVAVVPLARRLGVTRGSFYWHFDSRDELLAAAMELWEHEHGEGLLARLAAVADPRERLRMLADDASRVPPPLFMQLLRASDEPVVGAAVRRAAKQRVALIARTYRELGLPAPVARRRALMAYAHSVGTAHLLRDDPDLISRDRAAYAREWHRLLLA